MMNWETIVDLLLGIGLSAAAGFRVFVPFLVLSIAAVIGHIDLPTQFDWIETNQALIVLAAASLLEVVGYYIPWFDHLLDVIATPSAVVAGTLVTALATSGMNPLLQWTLAIIAGGGTAGLTRGMNNFLRFLSTSISLGLTNPVFATIELVLAIGLAILAITLPVATGVLVIVLLFTLLRKGRQFIAAAQTAPNSSTTEASTPTPPPSPDSAPSPLP
ncbi:DUF4126 domain-containing protein [Leptolyngbya ohadii]|uniref:DUF4126 domain-containing protein n=1 Tax=Leptolyngbya ohadii TaxID=1962290 RepID=UPI000B59B7C1|nr:DUF4126 domain-containing protein [Leptolyngbya ohadii]